MTMHLVSVSNSCLFFFFSFYASCMSKLEEPGMGRMLGGLRPVSTRQGDQALPIKANAKAPRSH